MIARPRFMGMPTAWQVTFSTFNGTCIWTAFNTYLNDLFNGLLNNSLLLRDMVIDYHFLFDMIQ